MKRAVQKQWLHMQSSHKIFESKSEFSCKNESLIKCAVPGWRRITFDSSFGESASASASWIIFSISEGSEGA